MVLKQPWTLEFQSKIWQKMSFVWCHRWRTIGQWCLISRLLRCTFYYNVHIKERYVKNFMKWYYQIQTLEKWWQIFDHHTCYSYFILSFYFIFFFILSLYFRVTTTPIWRRRLGQISCLQMNITLDL